MRHSPWVTAIAFAMASALVGTVKAQQALYSGVTPTDVPTSLNTFGGQPNPETQGGSGGEGSGDDYNTGYQSLNLTGFSFYGGATDSNQINYNLTIKFYSADGLSVGSVTPSRSEYYGIGYHTLSVDDFTQNGFSGIPITGAGYVVFQPYYQTVINVSTGDFFPAPNGTPQFTLGFGGAPTVGVNNPTISARTETPGPGVLSTGIYANNAGPIGQYGQFQLVGTPDTADSTSPIWGKAGSGNWDDAASWKMGIPNAVDSTANFPEGIAADSTVTLLTGQTVGTVNFENPLHRYSVAGPGTLTLSASTGQAVINSWAGSHTISSAMVYTSGLKVTTLPDPSSTAPSLTLPLNVTASGTLSKLGSGTLAFSASSSGITQLNLPAISINAGTLALLSNVSHTNRTLLQTSSLVISGGRLNVGANDVIYSGGASILSSLNAAVTQGYSNGSWNGSSGISSSAAATDSKHLTAVGIIINSSTGLEGGPALYGSSSAVGLFDGQNAGNTDVLLKYTYYGDANLSGTVDGSDYSRIDAAYLNNRISPNARLTGWFNGDFNYDGVIDGSDYTLIDNSFNTQGASLSSEIAGPTATPTDQIATLTSSDAVPEPTMIVTVIVAASLLSRRRRRS